MMRNSSGLLVTIGTLLLAGVSDMLTQRLQSLVADHLPGIGPSL
jgi:hypothetical protein